MSEPNQTSDHGPQTTGPSAEAIAAALECYLLVRPTLKGLVRCPSNL